ncbi:MAG: bifunctional phosphopantothenoylcysteine decarboxylase/phosphopantothenate--cysteine ligase CoaBC [candidate division WOR-3 bacterium]
MNLLFEKVILIGVTGGVAAYKVPLLVRELKGRGAKVKVILTENAKRFVSSQVLSIFSDGVFDSLWEDDIPHITLSSESDFFLILPADYNIIGKAASGVADDLLSTTIAAYNKKILFCPSMNPRMLENPVLIKNIEYLKSCGHYFLEPSKGPLACGVEGKGRLPSISRIVLEIEKALSPKTLEGDLCLITGGGTVEKIDPVRCLTNESSGKMAYYLAKYCYLSGGEVELILGKNTLNLDPDLPYKITLVNSAEEMFNKILDRWDEVDYLFMSAAVSDFTVNPKEEKIKRKEELVLELKSNIDILKELKKRKKHQFIVGFSLEKENLRASTLEKMKEKGCDIMVGNFVSSIGSEESAGIIISKKGEEEFNCSKEELAWKIIQKIK